MPMEQKLYKILSDLFNIKENEADNASMKNVKKWDSLKHIELIMSIEEEFEVPKIGPDEIVKMTSVSQIKDVLRKKGIQI